MHAVAAFLASIVTFMSGIFGSPLLASNSPANMPTAQPAAAAAAQTEITGDPFNDAAVASAVAAALAAAPSSAVSPPPAQTTINQPVIERIIERIVPQGAATVSTETLAAILADFEQSISRRIVALDPPKAAIPEQVAAGGNSAAYYFVPASQRIDQLTNTTINTPTITGGSISGASVAGYLPLSGGTITGALSGTDLTLSGVLTAGTLSVAGVSSGGAIFAPYFSATSTTATSTFAGGLSAAVLSLTNPLALAYGGTGTSSPTGALSNFQFLRSDTGAVARTAFDKLGESSVSVKDFGAKCDGSTDDSAAITAALATGRPVYVPKCTSPYVITSTVVRATNAVRAQGAQLRCEAGTVFDNRVANGPAFRFSGYQGSPNTYQINDAFENCEITTTTNPASSSGIEVTGVYLFRIANNYIHDISGSGIVLTSVNGDSDGVQFGTIENNTILRTGADGIKADNMGYASAVGGIYFKNNWALNSGGSGISIKGRSIQFFVNSVGYNAAYGINIPYDAGGGSSAYSEDLYFNGGENDSNALGGINIESGNYIIMDNVQITGASLPTFPPFGIKLGDGVHPLRNVDVRVPRFRIDYDQPFTAFIIGTSTIGTRITNPQFGLFGDQVRFQNAAADTVCIENNRITGCTAGNAAPGSLTLADASAGGRTLLIQSAYNSFGGLIQQSNTSGALTINNEGSNGLGDILFQNASTTRLMLKSTSESRTIFGIGEVIAPSSTVSVLGNMSIGNSTTFSRAFAPTGGLLVQGNVGIGTTTPGSLLSLNNIANFTTATSTFYSTGGINLTSGCFSVNGSCLGNGMTYSFTYPLINTGNTISLAYGTTTANTWSSVQTLASGFVSQASSTVVGDFTATGFHDTSGTTGGYKIDGNLILQASTTNTSVAVGRLAGAGLLSSSLGNVALGYQALNIATSTFNTAIGYQALYGAGSVVSGSGSNTAVGYQALRLNTSGNSNSAFGVQALFANTSGIRNSAFGVSALGANTTANDNSAFGWNAMGANQTGAENTAIGRSALYNTISGSGNVALGWRALYSATSTSNLVAVGYQALTNNTSGIENTAVGHQAGVQVTTGNDNTFSGFFAGFNMTTGNSNTVFGARAGLNATSTYENTLIGALTGQNISQAAGAAYGQGETLIGYNAGNAITTGTYNTFVGHQAGKVLTTGGSNTGIGRAVFNALTLGAYNTGLGHASGFYVTTGGSNVCLGNSACSNPLTYGAGIQTGSYNIGIGEYAGATGDFTNTTAIGNYAAPGASNVMVLSSASSTYAQSVGVASTTPWGKFVIDTSNLAAGTPEFSVGSSTRNDLIVMQSGNVGIGTTSPTAQLHTTGTVRFSNFGAGTLTTDASGNLSVSSDERLKNIDAPFTRGLADIAKLSPISYHWNVVSGLDMGTQYAGFSAQNVQAAIPEAVGSSTSGYLTLQDRPLIAAVVNAIKELSAKLDTLATHVSGFAESFTTKELVATNGRFDEVDARTLCLDGVCITKDQLAAVLAATGQSNSPGLPASASTPQAPVIEINGNASSTIEVGNIYNDLGARIIAPDSDLNLGIVILLDGATTTAVSIDTSTPGEHAILYTVTSPTSGLTGSAIRTIIVSPAEQPPAPPANDNPFNLAPANDNASSTPAAESI
ncbi:beta strand repeat-containing protein [Methylocystis hirsuta]|uniref:DUF5011 domain-containing protein n=1 Tax=Methylocystis hirsuta TaxID=369798 RepID=A0A3M9XWD2_9HYPH|nr:tail fiber domain-containing protein [Methylocystis hirsuta]RNJ51378.1 DUF5011 domain-containing protein [Methylocystis hirsuta]